MSLFPYKLGVVAVLGALPAWPQLLSFKELLVRAEQNNRDIASVRLRVDEAKGLLRQAGVTPGLTFSGTGATGRPLGTVGEEQFAAGLSKTFERGGKKSLRVELAETRLEIASVEYDERLRQLRYELRQRYADLAGETSRLAVVDRLIASLQESLTLTQARVDQGDAATLDATLIQADLSRVQAQRIASEGRWNTSRIELHRLAGLEPGAAATVDASFLPNARVDGNLPGKALDTRPELRAARLLEKQSDAERRLAEAQGRADITLSASYNFVKSRVDDTFGVDAKGLPSPIRDRDDILVLGVSIPLFQKNRNQGNVEASVARTRSAVLRREFLERSIPLEVEVAQRRLASQQSALDVLRGPATVQAEANVEVIRQAYQLGQLRQLDVLNEQRRLLDTQLARADAEAEVLRAWAELEKAVGGELQ